MGRTLLRRDGMRLPGVVGSPRTGDVRDCRMPQVSSARAIPRAGRPHETRRLPRLGLLGSACLPRLTEATARDAPSPEIAAENGCIALSTERDFRTSLHRSRKTMDSSF